MKKYCLLKRTNEKKEWREEDLEKAVQITLKKDNTNFESLIKNLENDPNLYDFVFRLIMNGTEFLFNTDNPIILFGKHLRYFKR